MRRTVSGVVSSSVSYWSKLRSQRSQQAVRARDRWRRFGQELHDQLVRRLGNERLLLLEQQDRLPRRKHGRSGHLVAGRRPAAERRCAGAEVLRRGDERVVAGGDAPLALTGRLGQRRVRPTGNELGLVEDVVDDDRHGRVGRLERRRPSLFQRLKQPRQAAA